MIRILFVGDGPRDHETVPPLVGTILGQQVAPEFRPWARLHGKRGYERKLLFASAQARARDLRGLVATVDADRNGRARLKALQAGRNADRTRHPALPTAIGCADPHHEVWLLDDATAVRTTLAIPMGESIPNVRRSKSPKKDLDDLITRFSPNDNRRSLLRMLAEQVRPERCPHCRDAGLAAFMEDARNEFIVVRTRNT
jgi:hypothetical protein